MEMGERYRGVPVGAYSPSIKHATSGPLGIEPVRQRKLAWLLARMPVLGNSHFSIFLRNPI
jgi:hypothetical protein